MPWTRVVLAIFLTAWASEARAAKFCILFCFEDDKPTVVSEFCQNYRKLIGQSSDSQDYRKLRLENQKKVAYNEAFYRCVCEGWKDKVCESFQAK